MKKVIIFGAGQAGQIVYKRICKDYEVIAFCDSNEQKQGTTLFELPIIAPIKLKEMKFDYIFIGADARESITRQLVQQIGISPDILLDEPMRLAAYHARRMALTSAKELIEANGLVGDVAEAGVFQGEFACKINEAFPNRSLYLFDTFEGFDKRDVVVESPTTGALVQEFNIDTSADFVLSRMPFQDKCIIRQGYFPESAHGIDNDFVFVSLDMDLYKPILEGLKFFYPRLVKGGYIFVHDFFSDRFSGVKKAVHEFVQGENGDVKLCPLGDECTIVVAK